jgi:hypothetical protein
MTWCIGYPVERDLTKENGNAGRRLGVLSVTSQPSDKVRNDGKPLGERVPLAT